MPGEAHHQTAAVYLIGGLLAVLLGLSIVVYQPAIPLAFAAVGLAALILLSRSPTIDFLCFFALFSGPPRMRARDPLASLKGEIDWLVLLHIFVWLIGALWVGRQLYRLRTVERRSLSFTWMHFLAILLAVLLDVSSVVSPGPHLTLFRASQMLVMILFGFVWVEKLGIERTLHSLFGGYAILAVIIGVSAIFLPALVFAGERVRGDYIANAGAVGAMGFILMVSYPPPLKRWLVVPILGLFVTLLIFSLTRSSYIAVMIFLMLAVVRRPNVSALRSVYVALALLVAMLLVFRLMPVAVAWIVRDPTSLGSFSDRIPLWRNLIPIMWQESPFLGLGFYAASRIYSLQYNAGIGTAHSAFVEVLVGGGIISSIIFLVLLAGGLLSALGLFLRRGKEPAVFTAAALLLAVLCIGMVSEEMVIASPTALTFWIVMSVIMKQGRSRGILEGEASQSVP